MLRLDALGAITETPGMLTRRYLTPAHVAAMEQVQAWMREVGLATRVDTLGTVIGRYEGRTAGAPALLLGSHIDTVVDAGRYDGALGVVAAIVAVGELARRCERLTNAIEVVAFGDEEGVRFPTHLLTSRALTGAISPGDLEVCDRDGIALREALRAAGGDADVYRTCERAPEEIAAYLEVHIEQGPVLQEKGLTLGAVTAISGATRMQVAVSGMAGHAGTVPMGSRRDALAAAAEMVLAVEHVASSERDVVATVGGIETRPGAPNVIPGRAEFSVDLRSPTDGLRARSLERLHEALDDIAGRRGVQAQPVIQYQTPAVTLDQRVIDAVDEAMRLCGHPPMQLPSGAGHDAMILAKRWPAGMLFVRCKDGISHNPAESITTADADAAIRVLIETLRCLDLCFAAGT
jgi:allantoate deiminase